MAEEAMNFLAARKLAMKLGIPDYSQYPKDKLLELIAEYQAKAEGGDEKTEVAKKAPAAPVVFEQESEPEMPDPEIPEDAEEEEDAPAPEPPAEEEKKPANPFKGKGGAAVKGARTSKKAKETSAPAPVVEEKAETAVEENRPVIKMEDKVGASTEKETCNPSCSCGSPVPAIADNATLLPGARAVTAVAEFLNDMAQAIIKLNKNMSQPELYK